jgi:short subunit dehydrogenase-like uncharacterized protein
MNQKQSRFLIYGAYGYTGRLIVQRCLELGLQPVLAGRDRGQLEELATSVGWAWQAFPLENPEAVAHQLQQHAAVLHCAGPFSHTAETMLRGCMLAGCHYLDITGEIAVFERIARLGVAIKQSGIVAIPGVGFDVVPSDCLAAYAARHLPTADRLTLAIYSRGGLSRGTTLTMAENLDRGGAVRQAGRIVPVPAAYRHQSFDFGDKSRPCVTIPWGDVSTAFHSTGIPNIEVYMCLPKSSLRMLTAARYLRLLFAQPAVKRFLARRIKAGPAGPSAESRQQGLTRIVAQLSDPQGETFTARLLGPEGYTFTALTAVDAAQRICQQPPPPGFYTPSQAFGPDYVFGFEGVERL